jgi:hypothetical protein
VEARWRLRQVVNVVNLSTPLGVGLALAGRGSIRRGPDGLLLAHAVRLPARAPAFTVGNVVLLRLDDAALARRPRLLVHEARHATQYACCVGLLMLPAVRTGCRVVVAAVPRRVVVQRLRGPGRLGRRRATPTEGKLLDHPRRRKVPLMASSGSARLLVASNRGPLSFTERDDGQLVASRGGGGLVSGLSGLGSDGVVWVCAALSDGDRAAARKVAGGRLDRDGHDTGGMAVRMLDIDPATFHRAYNAIANSTLWFIHHLLYAIPTAPAFDASFQREWTSYEAVQPGVRGGAGRGGRRGREGPGAGLPPHPAARRCCATCGRTCGSRTSRTHRGRRSTTSGCCPPEVARETLLGMLGADHAGFHSPRWARAFAACCVEYLGAEGDETQVRYAGRTTRLGVHPLGVDADALRERAAGHDVESRLAALRDKLGDRQAIIRVDRTELSKNISRGPAGLPRAAPALPAVAREGDPPGLGVPQPARPAGVPRVHRAGAADGGGDRGRVRHRRLAARSCST